MRTAHSVTTTMTTPAEIPMIAGVLMLLRMPPSSSETTANKRNNKCILSLRDRRKYVYNQGQKCLTQLSQTPFLSTNNHFILFKRRKSPHPRIIVVCSKWKTWGSDLGEEGRGYTGREDRYVHYVKRGLFYESVSTLLSLIVASIKDSAARPMANSKLIFREEPPAG